MTDFAKSFSLIIIISSLLVVLSMTFMYSVFNTVLAYTVSITLIQYSAATHKKVLKVVTQIVGACGRARGPRRATASRYKLSRLLPCRPN